MGSGAVAGDEFQAPGPRQQVERIVQRADGKVRADASERIAQTPLQDHMGVFNPCGANLAEYDPGAIARAPADAL